MFRLFPAEDLEHFFLDRRHFLSGQAGIDHLVLLAGAKATKAKDFLAAVDPGVLELEPFPPQEQQSQNIAKLDAVRRILTREPAEAHHQQLIVDRDSFARLLLRHMPHPEAERFGGRSLPGFLAVILADEAAGLLQEDGINLFSGAKFPSGGNAAPSVGLN